MTEGGQRSRLHGWSHALPRYFFDIDDGCLVTDRVGQHLDDSRSAKAEALRIMASFAVNTKHLREDGAALVVVVRSTGNEPDQTLRMAFNFDPNHGFDDWRG